MSVFYGNINEAAELAGTTIDKILVSVQSQVNSWIDSNINNGDSFAEVEVDEFYDIPDTKRKELILNHCPIISVTELESEPRSTAPILVDAAAFVINRAEGVIQLETTGFTGTKSIETFTKGFDTVRVKYKHGYVNVPQIIVDLATLMAAKWAKIQVTQAGADGLKKIKAADYEETYDTSFMSIKTEFDEMLKTSINSAKQLYRKG